MIIHQGQLFVDVKFMDTEEVKDDLQHDSVNEADSVASENSESLQPDVEAQTSDNQDNSNDPPETEVAELESSKVLDIDSISTTDEVDAILEELETTEGFEIQDSSPEPEPEQETESEPEPEQETDEQPVAEESGEEESESKPVKRRFAAQNDLENEFVSVKQRNPDVSIEDALAMAKSNLGINDPAPEGEDDSADTPEPEPALSSSDAQELADAKAEEHRKAMVDLDFEKAAELAVEIRQLDRKAFEIKAQEATASVEAENRFNESFDADQQKAIGMYPDAATPNSKFAERMREIDQTLKETGNDLYYSADKVSKIAMMAGNDLGVSPQVPGKSNPKPVAKSASKPKKAPIPPPSASGSAKTTQTSNADRENTANAQIDSLNSIESLEDFIEEQIGGMF